MYRILSMSLVAVAVCSLQSGCCCCRLPLAFMNAGMRMPPPQVNFAPPVVQIPPPPVVEQPPPVVFQPPPVVFPPPPVVFPPKDNIFNKDVVVIGPGKDAFNDKKDPLKDRVIPGKDIVFPPKDNVFPPKDNSGAPKDGFIDPFNGKGFPIGKTRYIYSQSTGQFKTGNMLLGVGYSGRGGAKNQPGQQANKDGPIPVGEYMILQKNKDFRLGNADAVGLLPVAGGNYFNRFPGEIFSILSDATIAPNNPPSGAIIVLPRNVWEQIIVGEPNTKLAVVP